MTYPNKNGTLCISIDVELLWGVRDMLSQDHIKSSKKVRYITKKLLEIFDKYEVGATWAILGHLFLDKCSKTKGKTHRNITRPCYRWQKKDWFIEDPATNIKKNPLWYGKDIVDMISNNKRQEIGSHSFSHLLYGMKGCSRKAAEDDIKECVKLAKERKIKLKSFVFPRNMEGHKSVLKQAGIKVYRGQDPLPFRYSSFISKAYLLNAFIFNLAPPTSKPTLDKYGLLKIPGSMIFLSMDDLRRFIPISFRVRRACKGIDRAIKKNEVFHLWFHPINFGNNTEKMLSGLEKVIKYARKKRISIKNMEQISRGD